MEKNIKFVGTVRELRKKLNIKEYCECQYCDYKVEEYEELCPNCDSVIAKYDPCTGIRKVVADPGDVEPWEN